MPAPSPVTTSSPPLWAARSTEGHVTEGCPGLHHRRAGYKDDRVAVQHEIDGGIFRDVPLG